MDCAHSFFSQRPIRNESSECEKKKIRHSHFLSSWLHLLFFFLPAFSHSLPPPPPHLSPLSLRLRPRYFLFFCFLWLFFIFFFFPFSLSLLFHLVNSISRGPRGAEKIEPQIEQSISVRIHQCQTTPSLLLSVSKHAHARAVIFD